MKIFKVIYLETSALFFNVYKWTFDSSCVVRVSSLSINHQIASQDRVGCVITPRSSYIISRSLSDDPLKLASLIILPATSVILLKIAVDYIWLMNNTLSCGSTKLCCYFMTFGRSKFEVILIQKGLDKQSILG